MGRFDHRHTRRLERLARELWRIDVHDACDARIEQPITDGYVMLTDVDLLVRTEGGDRGRRIQERG